jgi:hypothetical protein
MSPKSDKKGEILSPRSDGDAVRVAMSPKSDKKGEILSPKSDGDAA